MYVSQPTNFKDHEYLDYLYKLKGALYSLKQASVAWYEHLSSFLLKKGFTRGIDDTTIFIKHKESHILLILIYIDDIIF